MKMQYFPTNQSLTSIGFRWSKYPTAIFFTQKVYKLTSPTNSIRIFNPDIPNTFFFSF